MDQESQSRKRKASTDAQESKRNVKRKRIDAAQSSICKCPIGDECECIPAADYTSYTYDDHLNDAAWWRTSIVERYVSRGGTSALIADCIDCPTGIGRIVLSYARPTLFIPDTSSFVFDLKDLFCTGECDVDDHLSDPLDAQVARIRAGFWGLVFWPDDSGKSPMRNPWCCDRFRIKLLRNAPRHHLKNGYVVLRRDALSARNSINVCKRCQAGRE